MSSPPVQTQPIHTAAFAGDTVALQAELTKGINIDLADENGWTVCTSSAICIILTRFAQPLIWAAGSNKLDAVKFLLEHKATIDIVGADGLTALHHACSSGLPKIAAALLDKGADINKRSGSGDTPLIIAVTNKQPLCVKLLLTRDADASLRGKSGVTANKMALDIAKEMKFDDIVKLLQSAADSAMVR